MHTNVEIDCQDTLDISAVSAWWQDATQALNPQTQSPVCLSASSVQRIDAAGLQALLMLFKSAKKLQIEICWKDPSEALRHAAKLSGLEQALRLA